MIIITCEYLGDAGYVVSVMRDSESLIVKKISRYIVDNEFEAIAR